jgi:hypothetical protein
MNNYKEQFEFIFPRQPDLIKSSAIKQVDLAKEVAAVYTGAISSEGRGVI